MADYTPHTWNDDEAGGTPIDAATLNEMETGIYRASIPTKVTSLPASPYDGQEVYYEASDADGVYWHLRYRSASGSAYKWECLGGPCLVDEVDAIETTTSASYADLTTVGPEVTVPLAGEYEITIALWLKTSSAGNGGQAAAKLGAAATSDFEGVAQQNAQYGTPCVTYVRTLAASDVVKMQYKSNGSATLTAAQRVLRVKPVRVG